MKVRQILGISLMTTTLALGAAGGVGGWMASRAESAPAASVTTAFPGPRRRPTWIAARTLAPVEVPAKIPSSLASRRAMPFASSVGTGRMVFASEGSQSGGM